LELVWSVQSGISEGPNRRSKRNGKYRSVIVIKKNSKEGKKEEKKRDSERVWAVWG
jgi:hypothetical protein